MPRFSERLKADLTLLLVTVFWGTAFAVLRIALEHQVVHYLNGLRLLLGAVLLLPLAVWQKERIEKQQLPIILLTGLILFFAAGLQMIGLSTTTAGNAGFITSLYVVIVPFLLWWGWGEKPSFLLLVAVVLAVIGGFLLSTGGTLRLMTGDLWVGASSLFWALHVVIVGRFARRLPPLSYASGQFFIAGVLSLLAGMFLEHPSQADFVAILPSALYTGVFSVAVGFTLQVMAQKHTPAGDAALILSLEAVFAAFFGWLFVREVLLPVQLAGCGLILLAVILAQAKEFHSRLTETPSS
jgi:drug/metabolite transporter (DMT)-like permease